MTASMNEQTTE